MKRPLLALTLALFALPSSAADYYACDCEAGAEGGCTPGNNASAGTSSGTAWETYDKLQDAVAASACGDTFNFCKGGSFTVAGSAAWGSALDCTSNRRVIQSYQPASFSNDPLVTGSSGFSFGSGAGYTVQDIDTVCASQPCNSGIGFTLSQNETTLQRVSVDGFATGVSIGVNAADITIQNSSILNNTGMGVIGPVGDDALIDSNYFYNNGCLQSATDCGQSRALYHNCDDDLTGCSMDRDVTITNNTFLDNTNDEGAGCGGNAISLRGGRIKFNGNSVRYTGTILNACTPVRMQAITDPDEICTGCEFKRNLIEGAQTGLEIGSWTGGTIENNLFWVDAAGLSVPTAIRMQVVAGVEGPDSTNIAIRNNSIVVASGSNSAYGVNFQSGVGAGNTLYSNAIRMTGSDTDDRCLEFANSTIRDAVAENYTLCHRSNTNAEYAAYGSGNVSLATYQAASTNGDNSSESLDPGFASPPTDFTLSAGDAAIDAGHPTLSATTDYTQTVRPAGAGYDIGAYEYGASGIPFFRGILKGTSR